MPSFAYKARNESGKVVTGHMDAVTEDDLVNRLKRMNFTPVAISPVVVAEAAAAADRQVPVKVPMESVIMFTVQLTGMVSAGITLLNALHVISKQTGRPQMKQVIDRLIADIADGMSFSDALRVHPGVFSRLYVSMVHAGEAGGVMPQALKSLGDYLNKQEELAQTVQGALFYPFILAVTGIGVVLLIVIVVVPKFAVIFSRADIPLPLPTQMLYSFGLGLQHFWFAALAMVVALVLGIRAYVSTQAGRLRRDQALLSIPLVGELVRGVVVSRFCRTLAVLLVSGVPMLTALDIMKTVVDNEVFSRVIEGARRSVEQGERLDGPLKMSGEFPGDAVHMISVGEESGKLAYMLNKVADAYETSTGYAIKRLTTLIEPLFIVLMAVAVGFIMASLLIPIFDMVKTIQH